MPDDLAPRGYYEGLTARSLMAGWARRESSAGSRSKMQTHVWRAAEARAALQEASKFVGTDVAERRNLIMVNPAPGNAYATTRNLVAAYQMIQPGETARSHRHTPASTPSALLHSTFAWVAMTLSTASGSGPVSSSSTVETSKSGVGLNVVMACPSESGVLALAVRCERNERGLHGSTRANH